MVTEYKTGQRVTMAAPQKAGYTFDSWSFYRWNGAEDGAYEEWTTEAPALDLDKSVSFVMPAADVKMSANWAKGSISNTITHYFETNTKTYEADLLTTIKASSNTKVEGDWTIYYGTDNSTILGVSTIANDTIYYYKQAQITDGEVSVGDIDLIAAETSFEAETESDVTIQDKILTEKIGKMFTYGFTVYQDECDVTQYGKTDTFVNNPGIKVDYYYTLDDDYVVRTEAKALDGGASTGVTLVGAGTYYYSAKIDLKATVYSGYSIVGWYRAGDVLEGYTKEDGKSLGEYSLKKDISGYTPISTSTICPITVTDQQDYVVVTQIADVAGATVTISGKQQYSYGYTTNSTDRILTATAVMEDGADHTNYIYGYQWYTYGEDGERLELEGETASTFNFPPGKNKGSYRYCCEVIVKRQDNGREKVSSSDDYEIVVSPVAIPAKVTAYNGVFDGANHQAGIEVASGFTENYTIYYSEEELNEENYAQKGRTTNYAYKDVKVDDNEAVIPHKVYYYITSDNQNYTNVAGSADVTITPKSLTLSSSGTFWKLNHYFSDYNGTRDSKGTTVYNCFSSICRFN